MFAEGIGYSLSALTTWGLYLSPMGTMSKRFPGPSHSSPLFPSSNKASIHLTNTRVSKYWAPTVSSKAWRVLAFIYVTNPMKQKRIRELSVIKCEITVQISSVNSLEKESVTTDVEVSSKVHKPSKLPFYRLHLLIARTISWTTTLESEGPLECRLL